ncbi:MAG: radical SAM protein [Epsilonproteobacteria bacterium]|nr:radical SAM protein [Campylobacterota bacterium]
MSEVIFGPVNSRRFGKSLGIDLSPALKQCNFDCVYCELKGAKPVNKMQEIVSVQKVIDSLKSALIKHNDIDVITLTANGEPTLYPYLDELVREINKIKQNYKLLILSNGASIVDVNIQKTLANIDIVKLSLDCASAKCFKKIDRPYNDINIDNIIDSMKKFSKYYKGSLIIEVLVVEGINDKDEEFEKLNLVLNDIKPIRVDISTIDRPPAYKVKQVSMERLEELSYKIKSLCVSVAYRKDYKGIKNSFNKDEILNLISKRPQSIDDINMSFDDETKVRFKKILEEKKIVENKIAGIRFYTTAE